MAKSAPPVVDPSSVPLYSGDGPGNGLPFDVSRLPQSPLIDTPQTAPTLDIQTGAPKAGFDWKNATFTPDAVQPPTAAPAETDDTGDVWKSAAGSFVKAAGQMIHGIGELNRQDQQDINTLFGTHLAEKNPFSDEQGGAPLSEMYQQFGQGILDDRTAGAKKASAGVEPSGDLMKPSTWSGGKDKSARGYLMMGAETLGGLAPIIAGAIITKSAPTATQMAAGGAINATLASGQATDAAQAHVDAMSDADLAKVPAYKAAIDKGSSPDQARQAARVVAGQWAGGLAEAVGAVGGSIIGAGIGKAGAGVAAKVATNAAGRMGVGFGLGATEGAATNVAQTIAGNAGEQQAGLPTGLTDNTVAPALQGAALGVPAGIRAGFGPQGPLSRGAAAAGIDPTGGPLATDQPSGPLGPRGGVLPGGDPVPLTPGLEMPAGTTTLLDADGNIIPSDASVRPAAAAPPPGPLTTPLMQSPRLVQGAMESITRSGAEPTAETPAAAAPAAAPAPTAPIPLPASEVDVAAHQAATSPLSDRPLPTPAQEEAGNTLKGRTKIAGIPFAMEYAQGSTRNGTSADGTPWSREMQDHYSSIPGTKGADGEPVDAYVKPGTPPNWDGKVFVVDQMKGGAFDESKVMMGYASEQEARAAYLAHYPDGWDGLGAISQTSIPGLKQWLKTDPTRGFADGSQARDGSARGKQLADVPAVAKREGPNAQPEESVLPQLRGQGNQAVPRVGGELPSVQGGSGPAAESAAYSGSNQERRGLSSGQRALGDEARASQQPAQERGADGQRSIADDRGVGARGGSGAVGDPLSNQPAGNVARASGDRAAQPGATRTTEGALKDGQASTGPRAADTTAVQGAGRAGPVRGSPESVAVDSRPQPSTRGHDLAGLPAEVTVDGKTVRFGGFKPAQDAAAAYVKSTGRDFKPPPRAALDSRRAVTQTPEFKRWFGDSKVVDEKGEPLVVYHASTYGDFDAFDKSEQRKGMAGFGFYFTDQDGSNVYAAHADKFKMPRDWQGNEKKINTVPVFLKMGNPLRADNISDVAKRFKDVGAFGVGRSIAGLSAEAKGAIERAGYDGVITNEYVKRERNGSLSVVTPDAPGAIKHPVFVVFQPEQIKSATGNSGAFDPSKPSILESRAAPVFYSGLARAVDAKAPFAKNGTIDAEQLTRWLDARTKDGVVKKAELEATGLTDYLKLKGGKVSRDDVAAFLDQNGVKVTETVLGDGSLDDKLPDGWSVVESEDEPGMWEVRDAQGIMVGDGESRQEAIESAQDHDERSDAMAPKYASYQLPGGENYRELLLTLPPKPMTEEQARAALGAKPDAKLSPADMQYAARKHAAEFKSGHWDQPNILAHVRFNERESVEPYTPEQQAALDAHTSAAPRIAELSREIAKAAKAAGLAANDRIAAMRAELMPKVKLGEMTLGDVRDRLQEEAFRGPDEATSRMIDEKRALEDSLPPKPKPNTKRVLFLEELQSDWAQQGKKQGFATGPVEHPPLQVQRGERQQLIQEMRAAAAARFLAADPSMGQGGAERAAQGTGYSTMAHLADRHADYQDLLRREAIDRETEHAQRADKQRPPTGPFVQKTEAWVGLALKRMIRYAAENGFDRVALVNGQQSADRYDLSKQVNEIHFTPHSKGYDLEVKLEGGSTQHHSDIPADKLEDYVGKELAERIVDRGQNYLEAKKDYQDAIKNDGDVDGTYDSLQSLEDSRRMSGLSLQVGGEGMKAFYDKIVPNVANDVLKKLGGGRVGEVGITHPGNGIDASRMKIVQHGPHDFIVQKDDGRHAGSYRTREAAEEFLAHGQKVLPQPGFDITDKLRENVLGGIPLFDNRATAGQVAPAAYHGLGYEPGNGRQAVDDAARITGLSPEHLGVKVIDGPKDMPADVPMRFMLDTREIEVNPAVKMSRAEWALTAAEELTHALDAVGEDRTIAAGAPRLMRGGDLRNEFEALPEGSPYKDFFDYPLNPIRYSDLTDQVVAAELFGRGSAVYFGDGERMRAALPLTYEALHEIHSAAAERPGSDLGAVRGEVRPGAVDGGQGDDAQPQQGAGRRTGESGVDGSGAGLERHRAAVARVLDADVDGRYIGIPLDSRLSKMAARVAAILSGRTEPPKWAQGLDAKKKESLRKAGFWQSGVPIEDRLAAMKNRAGLRIIQGVFDPYAPVLKHIGEYPYAMLRMAKASGGGVEASFGMGHIGMNSHGALVIKPNTKGLLESLKPLRGETDRFLGWIAGNRAGRLMGEGREHNFDAADIAFLTSLTRDQSPTDKWSGPDTRAQVYTAVLKDWNAFFKAGNDLAQQSGIFSADQRKQWESEFYVPFFREREEGRETFDPSNISGMVNTKGIKRLKGGKEALNDLLTNSLANYANLLDATMRNNAARETLRQAERIGIAERVDKHGPVWVSAATGKPVDPDLKPVFILQQGRPMHYVVTDPLVLDSISSLGAVPFKGAAMVALTKMKHGLTAGVTFAPAFRVKNVIRDILSAVAANKMSYNVFKNVAQGIKYSSPHSDLYPNMLAGGAIMRMGNTLGENQSFYAKRLIQRGVAKEAIIDSPNAARRALRWAWDAYKEVGERSEAITRATVYKQEFDRRIALKQSEDEAHFWASFTARDVMDFSLQGASPTIRALTQTNAFMNARLQGMYKLGRSAKQDPKRMAAVIGATALMTIANSARNRGDAEIEALPYAVKEISWVVRAGDHLLFIPKPFEVGALATVIDNGFWLAYDGFKKTDRQNFANRLASIVGSQLSMNPIPTALQPAMQIGQNKNWFTDAPIESTRDQGLTPTERVNTRTTETAKLLSKGMNAVTSVMGAFSPGTLSPEQIDFAVNGYLGWAGTHVLATADLLLRPVMHEPSRPTGKTDDTFLIGDFVHDTPSNSSHYMNDFYDHMKQVQQQAGDIRQANQLGQEKKSDELQKENPSAMELEGMYAGTSKALGMLGLQERMLRESNASPKEKREGLDDLARQKNELAQQAEAYRAEIVNHPPTP